MEQQLQSMAEGSGPFTVLYPKSPACLSHSSRDVPGDSVLQAELEIFSLVATFSGDGFYLHLD
jgi:hypothetical protein